MENIRITSGNLRGRIIRAPKSDLVHPMGSREKLALFNMIPSDLPGAEVLDAFSGSGALGIEAVSRGAKDVVFVEKNAKIAGVIRENLKNLGLDSEVIVADAGKFETEADFDIIIADPPYDKFKIEDILHLTKFLENDGVFILSHPGDTPVIPDLKLTKSRKYAGATISIYRKKY